MTWLLIVMAIWDDGSYTFAPQALNGPSFATEDECLNAIKPANHLAATLNQPGVSHGYVCMLNEAWLKFNFKFRR
jgi:hypothetical protein